VVPSSFSYNLPDFPDLPDLPDFPDLPTRRSPKTGSMD
jgi:hypothetical protein